MPLQPFAIVYNTHKYIIVGIYDSALMEIWQQIIIFTSVFYSQFGK